MSLKITSASDPIKTENLIVTIFGQPGIGKTSLAFSASRPLLLDFDGGSQRAINRKDTVRIHAWGDVAGIEPADVDGFDTIVIDTVGRALEFLAAELTTHDPKLARKTGELSMQGYGALKTAFAQWLGRVRTFGKNIILIAHEKEDKDGDFTIVRVDAMGSTRTEVIRLSDLVGFVSADGGSGTLDFNPTDRHTGKNCVGFDVLRIPDLHKSPSWFAGVVAKALETMNALTESQRAREEWFNDWLAQIEKMRSVEDINDGLASIGDDKALLTAVHRKAKVLGFVPNRETRQYELPDGASTEEDGTDAVAA